MDNELDLRDLMPSLRGTHVQASPLDLMLGDWVTFAERDVIVSGQLERAVHNPQYHNGRLVSVESIDFTVAGRDFNVGTDSNIGETVNKVRRGEPVGDESLLKPKHRGKMIPMESLTLADLGKVVSIRYHGTTVVGALTGIRVGTRWSETCVVFVGDCVLSLGKFEDVELREIDLKA